METCLLFKTKNNNKSPLPFSVGVGIYK
uniref:Uncharacterized protein n=1 Tax=Rhizophora mucronata TaxID=61149 RepID=A0A2P2QII4_RHIMU